MSSSVLHKQAGRNPKKKEKKGGKRGERQTPEAHRRKVMLLLLLLRTPCPSLGRQQQELLERKKQHSPVANVMTTSLRKQNVYFYTYHIHIIK